jgi:aminopeptidase N
MKKLPFVVILFFTVFLHAQDFNIKHAGIQIKIIPEKEYVKGTNTFQIYFNEDKPTLQLDAHNKVKIHKVIINKRKVPFKRDGNKLIIKKDFKKEKNYSVSIDYEVTRPEKALYFVGWHNGNKNQVWTQGQGKNHSHWMPFSDDVNQMFTWRISIDFPKGYEVISNGKLLKKDTTGQSFNRFVYELDKPTAGYLLFVGAGKYDIMRDTILNIPHIKYTYPDAPQPDKTFSESERIFKLLPRLIGMDFPWDRYREIPLRDFIYGGMENVTATVFNDSYVVNDTAWNDNNPVNVLAHELAHQWFGDLVVETSSEHHWIHESFATYYAREAEKVFFGKNYYDFNNYDELLQIIDARKNGDTLPLLHGKASTLTFYQKGAFIIRMMRNKIGEKDFGKVVLHFLKNNAHGNVSTSDFKKSLYAVTGDSLQGFFSRWYESADIPSYHIQLQNDSLIISASTDYPVPIRLYYRNGTYRDTLTYQSIRIPDVRQFLFYLPDPGRKHLVEIHWELSPGRALKAIRTSLPDLDFYRLLKKIRPVRLEDKKPLLLDIASWNYYYPVHEEVLYQTKDAEENYRVQIAKRMLKHGIQNRKVVARAFGTVPKALQADFERMLNDLSYDMKENALYSLWNSFPGKRKSYLDLTRNTYGDQSRSFRMLWIILALNTPGYVTEEKGFDLVMELIEYGSPDWPVNTRMTAFDFYDMLQLINEKTAAYLKQAAGYFYYPLQQKAKELMKKYRID